MGMHDAGPDRPCPLTWTDIAVDCLRTYKRKDRKVQCTLQHFMLAVDNHMHLQGKTSLTWDKPKLCLRNEVGFTMTTSSSWILAGLTLYSCSKYCVMPFESMNIHRGTET